MGSANSKVSGSNFTQLTKEELPQGALDSLVDLASESLGSRVLGCSDAWFAGPDALIKEGDAIFIPDKYTENGKWMDGWESRRHNPDHDWAVIELGFPGVILGFDIDTSHFTGNHAPVAAIDACYVPPTSKSGKAKGGSKATKLDMKKFKWKEILPNVTLTCGHHYFRLDGEVDAEEKIWSHIRLRILPDGGVARLRVYGIIQHVWPSDEANDNEVLDLAFVGEGGRAIICSDEHYGTMGNLVKPGRGYDMRDGWETKRSRTPNHEDWAILKLGAPGYLENATIDTNHFKGNFPRECRLEACVSNENNPLEDIDVTWYPLLRTYKLSAHQEHDVDLIAYPHRSYTHVRLTIVPDGGIKRLRLFGRRDWSYSPSTLQDGKPPKSKKQRT